MATEKDEALERILKLVDEDKERFLGPPSAGKTTLLLALAGKLDNDLRVCHFFL